MVDLSEIAKETGLMLRPFITSATWEIFNHSGRLQGQDLQKRLLAMLRTLHVAITQRKGARKNVIFFSTNLENGGNKIRNFLLKAVIENQPSGQPTITVMLPSEGDGGKVEAEIGSKG